MRDPNNQLLQQMKENSDLFWELEQKHGRFFIEVLHENKQVILDTFNLMSTWELRVLVNYPNYYLLGLVKDVLAKRSDKAQLLKTRGRLRRREERVCLV